MAWAWPGTSSLGWLEREVRGCPAGCTGVGWGSCCRGLESHRGAGQAGVYLQTLLRAQAGDTGQEGHEESRKALGNNPEGAAQSLSPEQEPGAMCRPRAEDRFLQTPR